MREEYFCEEHGFRSTDPRSVSKHLEGHVVDAAFRLAAKVFKASLGIFS